MKVMTMRHGETCLRKKSLPLKFSLLALTVDFEKLFEKSNKAFDVAAAFFVIEGLGILESIFITHDNFRSVGKF